MADLLRAVSSPRARRNGLLLLIWSCILFVLFAVREVLLPFAIALALAYILDPLIRRLSERKIRGRPIPRFGAVIAIYLAMAAVVWLTAVFFVPQIYREVAGLARDATTFINELDEERIRDLSHRVEDWTKRMRLPVEIVTRDEAGAVKGPRQPSLDLPSDDIPGSDAAEPEPPSAALPVEVDVMGGAPVDDHFDTPPPGPSLMPRLPGRDNDAILTIDPGALARSLLADAAKAIRQQTALILGQVQVLVGRVLGFFFSIFVVLMITAFIASNTERVLRFVFSIVPMEDRKDFDDFLGRVDRGLSGVVRGQITICFVNGVLTLIGLLLLQVKFAWLLATIAMVFSLIPIFGSILSTIPIVLIGLASGVGTAILALLWIVGVHFLEANFLNPKILGDAAKIHPAVIVLSLVAGEHFYGLAGALFAVPLVSIALTLFRSAISRVERFDAETLGGGMPVASAPRPRARRIWREPRA